MKIKKWRREERKGIGRVKGKRKEKGKRKKERGEKRRKETKRDEKSGQEKSGIDVEKDREQVYKGREKGEKG